MSLRRKAVREPKQRVVMDPKPLNILLLAGLPPWHSPVGGNSIVHFQLAEALARAGHHVDYLAVDAGNSRRELDHARASYISLDRDSLAFPSGLVFPLYQYVKTFSRLKHYDIVQCEAQNAAFHAVHRALSRGSPRLVAAMYNSAIPRHLWQRRSFFEPYLLVALRLSDLVLCPSDYSRVNVSQAYGVALSKTRAFHGGVHDSFLAHTATRQWKGRFTLLFCGRLNGRTPVKRLDVLLKALPYVIHTHQAELNVIGTGPRLDEYVTLARSLGIEDEVHFLGHVDHSRMPAHYAAADLFVLPSSMESFGLVVAEAMACGLPVVSTRVGGIPEVVEEGVTGLLVPPDNPQALAEAITCLLNDPEKMWEMGRRGRERVAELFTWDKVGERVAGFYRSIL